MENDKALHIWPAPQAPIRAYGIIVSSDVLSAPAGVVYVFDQALELLRSPPSSLVYHFLVLFSVEAALAMAFGQWLREREEGTGRLTLALLVVGLARAALVAMALLAWQGLLSRRLALPPVERSVDALTALALMWAFVTMDDPVMLNRNTVTDIIAAIGLVLTLAGSAYSAFRWFQVAGLDVAYNSLLQDFVWGVAQILILVVGLLWMTFRVRYVYDAFLKAAVLLLFAAGVALHLLLPSSGDIAAATRLGLALTMPMLAAVTYRHVVEKLLTFDAFHAAAGEPPPMPEAVAEAIRSLPSVPGEEAAGALLPDEAVAAEEPPEREAEQPPVPVPIAISAPAEEQAPQRPAALPLELAREYPNAVHVVESLGGLVASLDVRDAANHVARAVATALRADIAAIVSLDEAQHLGVIVAAYDNIAQTFLEGGNLPLGEQPTMVNALGRLRQMRLTPQRNMRELRNFYKTLDITHVGPAYVQPLHSEEHRLGVLVVGSPYAKVLLSNAERTLLDRFGPLVTAALLNASAHSEVVQKIEATAREADEQAEALKARAQVLEKELEDARQQAGSMKSYLEDLERQLQLAREAAHQQESERVAELERELEETRNASQVELAALRARLTASAITRQEVALLQEQLMAKAREVISLQARAAEAQMTAEALRRQLQEQMQSVGGQRQLERLQEQVEQQKREIEALQTRLAEAEASAGLEFAAIRQQAQMEAADREAVSALQAQLAERNALIEALKAQLTEKSKALLDLQSNVGSVDESLRALEQQLRSKTEEAAVLQASLNEARAQAQERIQALQRQLEARSPDEPGVQRAVVEQLEAELAEKSAALERLETQLAEANRSLNALEAQLAATTTAVETAISDAQRVDEHDEVIASIAQELRSPMSSIMGYTDLLLGESVGLLGALQRKFLQRVKTNTERMASLLDNLISISALDSGQFKLEPQMVDVTGVLEEAIAGTVSQFQEKNITLRMQIDDNLPTITADRDALHQIVTHLLANASLASPVDGEVMLSASQVEGVLPGPQGEERETTAVLISVTDSGSGIKPEDQERVFLRKYRAENPLIEGLGDTGVALSIAKTLVDAHGGRIWLESEQNVGSTFNVLLPVERTAAGADAGRSG